MFTQIAIICVALAAAEAGKCSDHLLALKADGWNDAGDEFGSSQYGRRII